MAQQITTADVHRGTFRCQTCGTELPVFYHLRCPKCHNEFTLLPPAAQNDLDNDDQTLDLEDRIDRMADLMKHGRI